MLYEYDRWANRRVLQAVSALSPEQFTRDLGGSFRSVRDTLLHIIGGEWGWLTYWKLPSRTPASLADLWDRHDTLFNPEKFPDFPAVREKSAEIEKEQHAFVDAVTDEALANLLPFSHHPTQFGAPDAAYDQPFHLSSRPARHDAAPTRRQTPAYRFPRLSVGTRARGMTSCERAGAHPCICPPVLGYSVRNAVAAEGRRHWTGKRMA